MFPALKSILEPSLLPCQALAEVPATGGDQMHSKKNAMQPIQQESAIPPSIRNNTGSRFPIVICFPPEQSDQEPSGIYRFVDDSPVPQLITNDPVPHYIASLEEQVEMWLHELEQIPVGEALSENVKPKKQPSGVHRFVDDSPVPQFIIPDSLPCHAAYSREEHMKIWWRNFKQTPAGGTLSQNVEQKKE